MANGALSGLAKSRGTSYRLHLNHVTLSRDQFHRQLERHIYSAIKATNECSRHNTLLLVHANINTVC